MFVSNTILSFGSFVFILNDRVVCTEDIKIRHDVILKNSGYKTNVIQVVNSSNEYITIIKHDDYDYIKKLFGEIKKFILYGYFMFQIKKIENSK